MRELLGGSASRGPTACSSTTRSRRPRRTRVEVEGRTRVDEPVDVSRITNWTGRIDEPTRELVRTQLARIAEFYGYDVDQPLPVASAAPALAAHGRVGRPPADRPLPRPRPAHAAEPGLAELPFHPRKVKLVPYDTDVPAPT